MSDKSCEEELIEYATLKGELSKEKQRAEDWRDKYHFWHDKWLTNEAKVAELQARVRELEGERDKDYEGMRKFQGKFIEADQCRDRYLKALERIEELCGTPDPWQDDYDEIGRIATEALKEADHADKD